MIFNLIHLIEEPYIYRPPSQLLGGYKEEGQKRGMRERRDLKWNLVSLAKWPRAGPLVMGYVKCAGTERNEI